MSVININEATVKAYIKSIRPEDLEIRKEVDMGYSFNKIGLFELFEIRPDWIKPEEKKEYPFARIRYFKSKNVWKLYWKKANNKWEGYEPFMESTHLSELIKVIEKDAHHCFFG